MHSTKTIFTSLHKFSLYEKDNFATFFYSTVEKVWVISAKCGCIVVDGTVVKRSSVLNLSSRISIGNIKITFINLRSEIGLSQTLVEHFLSTTEGTLRTKQVSELACACTGNPNVLELLRKNGLFDYSDDEWTLNYKVYVDFLEGKTDPILPAVLEEIQRDLPGGGLPSAFNILTVWESNLFGGGSVAGCIGPGHRTARCITYGKGIGCSKWPHSRHAFQHEELLKDSADPKCTSVGEEPLPDESIGEEKSVGTMISSFEALGGEADESPLGHASDCNDTSSSRKAFKRECVEFMERQKRLSCQPRPDRIRKMSNHFESVQISSDFLKKSYSIAGIEYSELLYTHPFHLSSRSDSSWADPDLSEDTSRMSGCQLAPVAEVGAGAAHKNVPQTSMATEESKLGAAEGPCPIKRLELTYTQAANYKLAYREKPSHSGGCTTDNSSAVGRIALAAGTASPAPDPQPRMYIFRANFPVSVPRKRKSQPVDHKRFRIPDEGAPVLHSRPVFEPYRGFIVAEYLALCSSPEPETLHSKTLSIVEFPRPAPDKLKTCNWTKAKFCKQRRKELFGFYDI